MKSRSSRRSIGALAVVMGAFALMLTFVGTAAADDFPPPVNIQNTSLAPGCLSIVWEHYASGVNNFTVALDGGQPIDVGTAGKHDVCSLAPGSTHRVEVCAVYATEEADEACAPAVNLTTARDGPRIGELDNPQGKPTPPIVATNSGTDWIDFEWGWRGQGNAGFDYAHYYLFYVQRGGELKTERHGGGDWGYMKFANLQPNTTYDVQVQGCTTSDIPFVPGKCWGKSEWRAITTKPVLAYGPDTCASGFVWRDAVVGDHVCVTPERRQKVADDFRTANSRRPAAVYPIPMGTRCNPETLRVAGAPRPPTPPGCSPSGTEFCNEGLVPRDVPGEDVIVCVDQREADLIAQENANPNANRVLPS